MAELYAGLDVSDKTTRICIVDEQGSVVHEAEVLSTAAAIASALKPYRTRLAKVGQESGMMSQWLHKDLSRRRFSMICMDARAAHGVLSLRRAKTDVNDARGLAQSLRANYYSEAHIRSDHAQHMRFLLIQRSALKRKARDLEHIMRMSVKVLGARLSVRAGQISVKHADGRDDAEFASLSQSIVRAREMLLSEAKKLDILVKKAVRSDPVCRRFMTVPGVGPITALAFRTGIDDPARFHSSRAVGVYFGLTPRRYQSGESDYTGRISKRGDKMVRAALYEAAFSMIVNSRSECALRAWAVRLRAKRGLRIACVAAARKLAVVLHTMWVNEQDFEETSSKGGRIARAPVSEVEVAKGKAD